MINKSHIKSQARIAFISVSLLALLLLITIFLYVREEGEKYPLFMFIFLAATLGSIVSQSSRSENPAMEVPGFLYLTAYLLWKILVAIVFALFLYVVFMSGIVTGSLFPQFRVTSEECREYIDMMKFMSKCLPNSNEDVAKMLTWAFVAGYAEKFVPNLINKISSKAEGNDD